MSEQERTNREEGQFEIEIGKAFLVGWFAFGEVGPAKSNRKYKLYWRGIQLETIFTIVLDENWKQTSLLKYLLDHMRENSKDYTNTELEEVQTFLEFGESNIVS